VTNFDSLFLQGLDLSGLSLRNMSLTKVPSLISNLVRQCFKEIGSILLHVNNPELHKKVDILLFVERC